jgi:hypothetical protein
MKLIIDGRPDVALLMAQDRHIRCTLHSYSRGEDQTTLVAATADYPLIRLWWLQGTSLRFTR